ncbi:hypothetical protein HMPREF0454_03397 [Hafnia alvei ATCC 51873]|jgi:hypothetical protein|uniref:Uncharacterized protein n=1 Tax=Hafnia alvei ATCC 51873 TaxID=1002364 RepID=G9Y9X8_HAFAL|nr:hypothetical protein F652_2569 [Enterobacteriaceae bacterium bta3-1]EHM40559.1 hypothetical protein HMPREF0454_03397 [Hafnia alvei ATCC 51873]
MKPVVLIFIPVFSSVIPISVFHFQAKYTVFIVLIWLPEAGID